MITNNSLDSIKKTLSNVYDNLYEISVSGVDVETMASARIGMKNIYHLIENLQQELSKISDKSNTEELATDEEIIQSV